jgi:collagenase-like PrtC family protease
VTLEKTNKLTLGPVFFNWAPEKLRDFYFRIADQAPVDTVCLGEVICSKRLPFYEGLIPDIAERLVTAGKEVLFSTLALVMSKREVSTIRELAQQPEFYIEANDTSAISCLKGRRFAVGPFINIYNEATMDYLVDCGADRICLACELPSRSIRILAGHSTVPLELQVFGRMPLALSARCYHARLHSLHKDGCQFVCDQDPDGRSVETLEGDGFLAINGIQTMSHSYVSLLAELQELQDIGIHRFRLSPQDVDMVGVAQIFRQVLNHSLDPREGQNQLENLSQNVAFSNGFYHGGEGCQYFNP